MTTPLNEWHIGDVIVKLRKHRRMNQTALAKKVGVNKATIVRAEAGEPKVSRETYIHIARVLGTTLATLEVEAARLARESIGATDKIAKEMAQEILRDPKFRQTMRELIDRAFAATFTQLSTETD